jgi:hypothetical protein
MLRTIARAFDEAREDDGDRDPADGSIGEQARHEEILLRGRVPVAKHYDIDQVKARWAELTAISPYSRDTS